MVISDVYCTHKDHKPVSISVHDCQIPINTGYLHRSFLATTKMSANFISRLASHRQHRSANLWVVSTDVQMHYVEQKNFGPFFLSPGFQNTCQVIVDGEKNKCQTIF